MGKKKIEKKKNAKKNDAEISLLDEDAYEERFLSNKGRIYLHWMQEIKSGKSPNAESLHEILKNPNEIKIASIKIWMRKWGKGNGIPKIEKGNPALRELREKYLAKIAKKSEKKSEKKNAK